MLESPGWCRQGPLLSGPPLLFGGHRGARPTLVAALSEAGRLAALEQGVSACTALVATQCIDAGAANGAIGWRFVEPALLADPAALETHLAALLAPGHASRHADVLDREETADRAHYLLHVPADLVWFRGHFPGRPVLPGVVQVDWAIGHARALGFAPDRFCGLPRLKFKAVVQPDAVLRLVLRRLDERRLGFVYQSATAQHSAGRIDYLGCNGTT